MSEQLTLIEVLTLDEIETLEQITGKDFGTIFAGGSLSGKALKVIVWILRKRNDPNAKIDDAGKLTMMQSQQEIEKALQDPKA